MGLFELSITDQPWGRHAALQGEIDLSTVEEAGDQLREAAEESATVAVDLREVTFLDSSGLRLLLCLRKEITDRGGRMVVVRGPRRVARVFELTGAEEELELVDDPAELSSA